MHSLLSYNSFFFSAVAQRAYHLHLVMMCWSKWSKALHRKQSEEDRLHAAESWAVQSTQRRAVEYWRACILNIKQTYLPFASLSGNYGIVRAYSYQYSCLTLELVTRCGVVQRRGWKKQDCNSASSSSCAGEIPGKVSNCVEVERTIIQCIDHCGLLLQHAGLQGLSLNVIWNKMHRLNHNMAVQHYHQTVTDEYSIILILQCQLHTFESFWWFNVCVSHS